MTTSTTNVVIFLVYDGDLYKYPLNADGTASISYYNPQWDLPWLEKIT